MSSGHSETPIKVDKASESVNVSCYRLYKSVEDTSHWRNLYSKGIEPTIVTISILVVRRKGDLAKFDLSPGIRACPSSFVHRAEWPPVHNCDHSL